VNSKQIGMVIQIYPDAHTSRGYWATQVAECIRHSKEAVIIILAADFATVMKMIICTTYM
jgi:hypothetical protein